MNKIRHGKISLTDAKSNQKDFKEDLKEINKRNMKKNKKSKGQKNALYNNEMLYKAKKEVIKYFDDYFSMVSEAKL